MLILTLSQSNMSIVVDLSTGRQQQWSTGLLLSDFIVKLKQVCCVVYPIASPSVDRDKQTMPKYVLNGIKTFELIESDTLQIQKAEQIRKKKSNTYRIRRLEPMERLHLISNNCMPSLPVLSEQRAVVVLQMTLYQPVVSLHWNAPARTSTLAKSLQKYSLLAISFSDRTTTTQEQEAITSYLALDKYFILYTHLLTDTKEAAHMMPTNQMNEILNQLLINVKWCIYVFTLIQNYVYYINRLNVIVYINTNFQNLFNQCKNYYMQLIRIQLPI
ncbi:hypothetical protein RFI_12466, partial [Reticulomyxa filosa]